VEIISLVLIIILFWLGITYYRKIVISEPNIVRQDKNVQLAEWAMKFDELDAIKSRSERAEKLHSLLIERRIIINGDLQVGFCVNETKVVKT